MKKLLLSLLVFSLISSVALAADVYVTKYGKKYHTQECALIKDKEVSKHDHEELTEKNMEPCKICLKGIKDAKPEE